MTQVFERTKDSGETLKAYLLDEDKCITWSLPSYSIKGLYQYLNVEGVVMSQEWGDWNCFDLNVKITKNYFPEKRVNLGGNFEDGEAVKQALGKHVFDNAIVIQHNISRDINTFHDKAKKGGTGQATYFGQLATYYLDKYKEYGGYHCEYIIIPYAYVKVLPRQEMYYYNSEATLTVIDLEFYSASGKVVARLNCGSFMNHTSLKGRYVMDGRMPSREKVIKTDRYVLENEIPVMPDWGCIDCKDSEYHLNNGVFLRCTLCGEEVREVEYDGEHYPEYCPRNIAKKIRAYQEKLKA